MTRSRALSVEPVQLALEGAVARLVLNRPHVLNAGDADWVRALGAAVSELGRHPELRVVVVTGAGRAFSTGVDLTALADGQMTLAEFRAWEDAITALERLPALVLAGINGHCLGGGLQLTLVCDYRLAAESALIGLPAVKECLIPSMALYRLPRLIGLSRARELILLGDSISAREAERYGLVNRVVPDAEFSSELEAMVRRGLELPAASLAASKQLLADAFDRDVAAFRAKMEARFRECLASEEHRAAMDQIRKRTPR